MGNRLHQEGEHEKFNILLLLMMPCSPSFYKESKNGVVVLGQPFSGVFGVAPTENVQSPQQLSQYC